MTDWEIEFNKEVIRFNKRFADGEQQLRYRILNHREEWEKGREWSEPVIQILDEEPLYSWQANDVYNKIPLYITRFTAESQILNIFSGDQEAIETAIYGKNGLVDLLAPLQRAYNAALNRRTEFINRLSFGTLCVEDGSVDVDEIEEEGLAPGKVIVYRQGTAAPQLNIPQIDTYQFNMVENQLRDEMDRVCNAFIDRYNVLPPRIEVTEE